MAQFCDDSLEQWFLDLRWAWNEDKVRALLLDIFSHRVRFSPIQGRLWCRIVHLYWRAGWTARQIGDQFGVSLKNIRRIIQNLRREAARYFGQSVQPTGQSVQPTTTKPKSVPLTADPTNESQEHWEKVLASHGLFNPDRRARGWSWRNPVYKFEWNSQTSVHALGWGEFYETQAEPKPTFHTQQKTGGIGSWGKAKQIATKTLEIDGKSYDARVFETGRACTYVWNAEPRRSAGSTAHDTTLKHVDRAIDGDPKAQRYLREYDRLEAEKFTDTRGFKIVPGIDDPCEGRPFFQFIVAPTSSVGTDVWIDTDGTVYKKGSNQACGHVDRDTKISSDETTRTACQIGRAELNAGAIPKRANSFTDVEEQRNFFIEKEAKGNFLYSKAQQDAAIQVIKAREIPKQQLADIANVPAARLSDYLRNRPVPQEQADRITEAVNNIMLVWKTFAPIKIALDDPKAFAKAVELANQVHAKLAEEETETVQDEDDLTLRMKPIEGGTASAAD